MPTKKFYPSWRQEIVLRAAAAVDYLGFHHEHRTNIEYGVFRSLVILGYLRQHHHGWEITEEGRYVVNRLEAIDRQKARQHRGEAA